MSILNFMIEFGTVAGELARILGVQYVPGSPANNTPIGQALEHVLRLNNSGRIDDRDWELLRLANMAKRPPGSE